MTGRDRLPGNAVAKEVVLARIVAAHRAAPPPELGYEQIVRRYLTRSEASVEELRQRLIDRLIDYRALVRTCSEADLAATVAAALAERGVARLVVPPALPDGWLAGWSAGTGLVTDGAGGEPLSVTALDAMDGVLTGCAVAVAETGTLILDGSPDQGRRALTLVPDYHLCVVRAGRVVGDVPEALARLDPVRPLTLISGPSATSDIELDRVEGVHGPRTLEVIVVSP